MTEEITLNIVKTSRGFILEDPDAKFYGVPVSDHGRCVGLVTAYEVAGHTLLNPFIAGYINGGFMPKKFFSLDDLKFGDDFEVQEGNAVNCTLRYSGGN